MSFLYNLLKIKTHFAPFSPPSCPSAHLFMFFSGIGIVSLCLQEPPSVMLLCLSAEPKVKTGGQQVSWKSWSLALSRGKTGLSSSVDLLFGNFCLQQPAENISDRYSQCILGQMNFSDDVWRQVFFDVASIPALLGRSWKNSLA